MLFSPALLAIVVIAGPAASHLTGRADCSDGYTACAPPGATTREVPALGGDWAFFYQSLISTVPSSPDANNSPSDPGNAAGGPVPRAPDGLLCCAATTACMLIQSYNLPACYDKYTTDYFLNDGSHGTVSNGSYTTTDGGIANLITGNFTLSDGTRGNIYDNDPADRPDTTALAMPTPFTSSGVGSAIPASELASVPPTTMASTSVTVPASMTAAVSTSTIMTSLTDTQMGSGILPPYLTQTLTSTPSTAAGTVGFSNGSSMASSGTAPGSSGGFTIMSYTTSSILPPITNVATVSVIYSLALKIILSVVASISVG